MGTQYRTLTVLNSMHGPTHVKVSMRCLQGSLFDYVLSLGLHACSKVDLRQSLGLCFQAGSAAWRRAALSPCSAA